MLLENKDFGVVRGEDSLIQEQHNKWRYIEPKMHKKQPKAIALCYRPKFH